VLPDRYDYGPERLRQRFHDDLCSFARQLVLTDPQDLATSAKVLQDHRRELAFVADLIAWSPVSYDDASDHNTGVSLSRALHVYRAKQSRRPSSSSERSFAIHASPASSTRSSRYATCAARSAAVKRSTGFTRCNHCGSPPSRRASWQISRRRGARQLNAQPLQLTIDEPLDVLLIELARTTHPARKPSTLQISLRT
jgi:hypothetical protein